METTPSPSLFDRLGGRAGIGTLVADFYAKVMADAELGPFFRGTDVAKLQRMQEEFLAMALGGPPAYSGRPLAHVHHGRGITARHFAKFAGHLLATLREKGATEADAAAVIDRLNSQANEVTGTSD